MTRRRLLKVGLPFWGCSARGLVGWTIRSYFLGTGVHVFIARALLLRSTHGHKRLVRNRNPRPASLKVLDF
ncbi:hypothetical protein DCAR_0206769 [Daucus carota subsp. sativus]|uniref:Uncharacterized protein n=1 Tax=Daucus carota subsp. sativus TaxID=79200 RepID=A0A166DF01_DAUCS|nr:hypothetical protein DCAR_0206769 [Daucus carota subsp. sativus]